MRTPRARIAAIALILPALAALYSCSRPGKAEAGARKGVVAVSVLPQSYFVSRIAGDRFRVIALVGPGRDPHSYDPSPRQMADLAEAALWFTVGVEFEKGLLPKVASLYPGMKLIDTTVGIKYRLIEAHGHGGDSAPDSATADPGNVESGKDPHVWLGRDSVKIQAAHIRDALSAFDAAGASLYSDNYKAFIAEIDAAFDALAGELAPLKGKPVFVFHPAFGYFLDEFGIIQEAVETGGKEPTQKALAALIEGARKDGAKVLFVQVQFPASAAKTVAAAIGGSVVVIDPLAADWPGNLKAMSEALRKAAR